MDDLINRKAAIAALGERPMVWTGSDYELGARNQYDMDKLAIETVPPAQPYTDEEIQKIQDLEQAQFDKIRELAYQKGKADMQAEIVRCKDCKHNQLPSTSGNASCEIYYGMTDQNGFCHMAERREVSE